MLGETSGDEAEGGWRLEWCGGGEKAVREKRELRGSDSLFFFF